MKTMTKEEIKNMIGMNCDSELKLDSLDFLTDDVYQWHLQQQIKLLEEVKKEFEEIYDPGIFENKLNSKITNLKKEL